MGLSNPLRFMLGMLGARKAAEEWVSIQSCADQCKQFTIDVSWGPTPGSNIFSRDAILTNGSFPGPSLKLTQGDCVDFTVINNMPNVTAIHFHGIRQLETPWADGVPGVSVYPVQPGSTYNYRWNADEPGTYFYHSHYKGQMMDGLYGAIVISPAEGTTTPFSQISQDQQAIAQMTQAAANVETLLLSDWSRFTFNEFYEIEKAVNLDWACADAFVINGYGSQYCPDAAFLAANMAPPAAGVLNGTSLTAKGCIPASNHAVQGPFQQNLAALPAGAYDTCTPFSGQNYTYQVNPSDGWAAMSFISPSGVALFKVTIDGHKLYVYEINGNYIVPQEVDEIPVDNGDRISVLVKLDQAPADYTIRVANDGLNQVISGFGVLSYGSANVASSAPALISYGGLNSTPIVALDRFNAPPYPDLSPQYAVAPFANKTYKLDIMKTPTLPISWGWVLNGDQPYNQTRDDDTPPLLFMNPATIPDSDLILRSELDDWVDLIIIISGPLAEPHPIHKHANKYFVIGAGVGNFTWDTVAEAQAAGIHFNTQNPAYVDGFTSIPAEGQGAWMVFRYQANTPGAWLLHCHVQSHLSGGMAVAILDATNDFPTPPQDPGAVCGPSQMKGKWWW